MPRDNPIAIDVNHVTSASVTGEPWIRSKSISMPAMKNRNDRPRVEKNATTVVSSARSSTFGPDQDADHDLDHHRRHLRAEHEPTQQWSHCGRHKDHNHCLLVTHGPSTILPRMPAIIGVDVGGTFTDVALIHEQRLVLAKVSTTVPDQSVGVLEAVALALGARRPAAEGRLPPRSRHHRRHQCAAGAAWGAHRAW